MVANSNFKVIPVRALGENLEYSIGRHDNFLRPWLQTKLHRRGLGVPYAYALHNGRLFWMVFHGLTCVATADGQLYITALIV